MRQRGFTLIEILIVISIIVILAGLGAPLAMRSMAQARVNRDAGHILSIASQARSYAILKREPADQRCYGIVLRCDPADNGRCTASLALRGPADAGDDSDYVLVRNAAGEVRIRKEARDWTPVTEIALKSSVLWVGDKAAESLPTTTTLAWYYQYRSGLPIAHEDGKAPSQRSPIAVGLQAPDFSRCADPNGDLWGLKDYRIGAAAGPGGPVALPIIAPGSASEAHGLSLRSRDQSVRIWLAVHPGGAAASGAFIDDKAER